MGVNDTEPSRAAIKNPVLQNATGNIAQTDSIPAIAVDPAQDTLYRRGDGIRDMVSKASYVAPKPGRIRNTAVSNEPFQGDDNYVKTIASLSRSVSSEKDSVMRPSERVAFERDLAVVDDAIDKMKTEVKKNPKNESAKQVLYSSYQNKIDLLNSVSQKQELMASLK